MAEKMSPQVPSLGVVESAFHPNPHCTSATVAYARKSSVDLREPAVLNIQVSSHSGLIIYHDKL